TLQGNGGADTLDGGTGTNTINGQVQKPSGSATLSASGTLTVNGGSLGDSIAINILFRADTSDDIAVTIDGTTTHFNPQAVSTLIINGNAGDDQVFITGDEALQPAGFPQTHLIPVTINGGDGNDSLGTAIDGNT